MQEKTRRKLVAGAAGALDPIFRKWAQELALRVPQNSFVRSKWFEVAAGVLKGFVEASAEHLPVSVWATVEKATDFGDFFAGALGVNEKQSRGFIDSWTQKFLDDAAKRTGKARDPKAETRRLKLELELRRELLKSIEQAGAKKKGETPQDNFKKYLAVISEILRKADGKLKPAAEALRAIKEQTQRKAGFRT